MLSTQGVRRLVVFDNYVASTPNNVAQLAACPCFELIAGDVRDYDVVAPLVANSDFVFHLAASKLVVSDKRPRVDLESNIIGTFNILQAAKDCDVRVVYTSTGSVLGSSDVPMAEDHAQNPTTLYGISKLTAEKYCIFHAREFGVKVSILRYFHVFGPRQDYAGEAGVINIFLSRVLQGQPPIVFGTGEQIRCFTYVIDSVAATLLLATKDETVGEVYNVASKTRMSVRELAELVIQQYGPEGMVPEIGPARRGENFRPIPDTTKIERLGFQAQVPFLVGLELCKQWVEEQ
ncbi:unnamed protein product [marine sediment metagenome]|uniref:NAD-dependent epimerase/dehydratase domain-containing protein n=1 Tax=marine sediment metagenome TaxID=412755 RepID=X0UDD6_9ZZZZ